MSRSIKTAVIAAAGLGTRLLSVTKEQPKEMLPVFAADGQDLSMKPMVQMIFEQLYDCGFRDFCFVVGRGKRAIEDHFTPDTGFVDQLRVKGKHEQASRLLSFYEKAADSKITWVNQPEPLGFGDAVSSAKTATGDAPFLVHAGDTYIISRSNIHLSNLTEAHGKAVADVTMMLKHVSPDKGLGFAIVSGRRPPFAVERVVEKPSRPPSDLAIMPVYIFNPVILDQLKLVKPGIGGEIQLTDGIQRMIEGGYKVQATVLPREALRLDIGTPENYWDALRDSRQRFLRTRR